MVSTDCLSLLMYYLEIIYKWKEVTQPHFLTCPYRQEFNQRFDTNDCSFLICLSHLQHPLLPVLCVKLPRWSGLGSVPGADSQEQIKTYWYWDLPTFFYSNWEVIVCALCGGSGSHRVCCPVRKRNEKFTCQTCLLILDRIGEFWALSKSGVCLYLGLVPYW